MTKTCKTAYRKNGFTKISKNLGTDLQILLDYQNNYARHSS